MLKSKYDEKETFQLYKKYGQNIIQKVANKYYSNI